MNNIFVKITLFFIAITTIHLEAVENSIVPIMESFECIENLPLKKFTKNQYSEICKALEMKDNMVRLVTYNMLFDVYDHDLHKDNRWPSRLPRIVELMQEVAADIICTQELRPNQVNDIVVLLKDYSFFSGCQDKDGESYGIFYRKDRFELLSSQVIYPLSMLELKDRKTDKIFYVFNTHLSFSTIEKREAHARSIVKIIEPFAKEAPVIFTGDLNTFANRLDLTVLPYCDGDYIHRILSEGSIKDSQSVSLLGHFGPISTFTNSPPRIHAFEGTGTPGIILDYIYVSNKVTVLTHATETGTVDGHHPSDHMPVLVDLLMN